VAQSCNHRYSRSKREWSDQGKSSWHPISTNVWKKKKESKPKVNIRREIIKIRV
jgi:hypothetical protein